MAGKADENVFFELGSAAGASALSVRGAGLRNRWFRSPARHLLVLSAGYFDGVLVKAVAGVRGGAC